MILKPDPEKEIECYVDADLAGGWNQEEVKDPDSVIYRTGYVITNANFPIILVSRLQTEIALSTTEAEYIALSQVMRDILPFVSLTKDIEFLLKLQGDTPTILCSLFEKPVTVHEDNQGMTALTFSPQIQPRMKHIAIKYHHFRSFVANGDVDIKHVDTKEQIADFLRSR